MPHRTLLLLATMWRGSHCNPQQQITVETIHAHLVLLLVMTELNWSEMQQEPLTYMLQVRKFNPQTYAFSFTQTRNRLLIKSCPLHESNNFLKYFLISALVIDETNNAAVDTAYVIDDSVALTCKISTVTNGQYILAIHDGLLRPPNVFFYWIIKSPFVNVSDHS